MVDENGVIEIKERGTKITLCTCYSAFQDKRYGKGLRVHNKCSGGGIKGTGSAGWRCTACGKSK